MVAFIYILLTYFSISLSQSKNAPNIIFFMADQQRQDSIGSYPGSAALTPNIDSIASDGVLFTNSWTSTPSCTPARSAILTGKSPWGHGMLGYGAVSTSYPYELVHPFNNIGYLTAAIGKNHFGFLSGSTWLPALHGYQYFKLYDGLHSGLPSKPDFELEHTLKLDPEQSITSSDCANAGYDDYDQWFQTVLPGNDPLATGKPKMDWNSWRGASYIYNSSYHPTAWVAREAIHYLDTIHDTSKPFFLKISFHRPHSPYDPPQEYIDFVKEEYDLTVINNIIHGNGWDDRFTDPQWCGASNDAWCGWMDANDTNMSRITYYANVRYIDDKVGQILDKLRELHLYNKTYILWTADHGDQLGDHNLWRKTYPYNSNAKVPMIIKWPTEDAETTFNVKDVRIKRGTVNSEHIVELRDLLPTFHNVSGIRLPGNWSTEWSGMNMNCILHQDCKWRTWLDLEHSTCYNETNHWNALTDGVTYKYIFNAYFANESLFDMIQDPNEMNDLAPLAPHNASLNDILVQWRSKLIDMFEKQRRGPNWVQNGTLKQRIKGQTYGLNYPDSPAPCQ
eukprot:227880_1